MKMIFPVVVKKLKKIEDKDVKVENGVMPDYAPKFVLAESSSQAREITLVELIKADVYDAEDPMVKIEVCSPFEPAGSR